MNKDIDIRIPLSKNHVRKSLFLLAVRIFFLLFIINTAYACVIIISLYSTTIREYGYILVIEMLWVLHAIQFIAQTVVVLFIILQWATDEYFITDAQLFHFQGIWHVDEHMYELAHIKSVKLYQSIFGKIFNYGKITLIFGARGYSEIVRLMEFPEPKKYERLFRNFVQPE